MSLLRYIAEVADEPFVLDPANPEIEHRENTWLLDCPAVERTSLTTAEVVAAFEHCANGLQRRLPQSTQVVFYVWHDQQAGQLRCSTTSISADRLPFGARVVPTPLEKIVEEFLAAPGFISWAELQEADEADEPEPEPEWTVEVWHLRLMS
ncbi:hypothetical protein ACFPJ1_36755 [Kribbella qitaiheensis]|uniref:hypothetical protein n=1 Tax=Kribbella qitaiheensis TaxID=1544730 RepID=UPI0036108264